MTPAAALLVLGAGFVGGAANAVAGGGTLVTFPALLAAGLPPVTANTTSSVGLLSGYVGGSVAYRRELEGQGARARGLLLAGVVGGVLGAVVLLVAPGDSFAVVVPYLVLLACLLLAVQPWLARLLAARGAASTHPGWEVKLAVGVGAVYGGYFGAGLGVMLLAVLGLLVADDLQRLNALKGVLALVINLVGALVFVVTGHVHWLAAGLLAVGAALGATVGVAVARRLPPAGVRAGVVVVGVAVAVTLLVRG
ncbi:MAG: hypothetical protein JWN87_1742 [Frankiales bacterium]|nr:hypothetical protein [Frankiales bacterium]